MQKLTKRLLFAVMAFAAATSPADARGGTCPPPGWDRAKLEQLKAAKFEIADKRERERFAVALVACVASPDPFLRDGIAFDALSHMLRGEQLGAGVRVEIARDLLERLQGADPQGFEQPFAALVLSEVVRADRIAAYLPRTLSDAIAGGAVSYVASVTDYRGFDEREGWRHGVAHGADLLMQIARNPNFADRARLRTIRDAVGAQVAPEGHFYIYGEPERLMQPIIALAQRGVFSQDEWSGWFEIVARPAPLAAWDDAFRSQAGLAKVHNTKAFLYAVWLNARISKSSDDDVLLPGAEAALRTMP